jgi:predicted short-subunit dehydrogenase-like oxidoreductase (DUF2520 family)
VKEARIGFVGAGVVGTTLARAMHSRAYRVVAVSSRSQSSARRLAAQVPGCESAASSQEVADACDVLFLTVPDDAIADVAASVRWRPDQAVVHCSGASSLRALAPARGQGAMVGAFHPFQTFADPDRAQTALEGVGFAVEAEPPLRQGLEELAVALGGWPIHLDPQDRVLYHASAVVACGFLVTLVKLAADLWGDFAGDGRQRTQEGFRAIMPLVRSTLDGLEGAGVVGALTGPFVRGDLGTVESHLTALEVRAPGFLPLYCHLALAELPLARAKGGLTPEREGQIRGLLHQRLSRTQETAAGPEASSGSAR